jgi:hypothetical protein
MQGSKQHTCTVCSHLRSCNSCLLLCCATSSLTPWLPTHVAPSLHEKQYAFTYVLQSISFHSPNQPQKPQ